MDADGKVLTVKNANFLAPLPILRQAFRRHFLRQWEAYRKSSRWRQLRERGMLGEIEPDPGVWSKDWGVYIKPFGDGANAIKYLGLYVCRSVISDARIVHIGDGTVTFSWKDRSSHNRQRTETISGVDFVARYLRHVLPHKLRRIRYFGYCHPAAKKKRERIAFHTGKVLRVGPDPITAIAALGSACQSAGNPEPDNPSGPRCPSCQRPMKRLELKLSQLNPETLTALLRAPPSTFLHIPL